MTDITRETSEEFAAADLAANERVAQLFFLMRLSGNQAVIDVQEFMQSLSPPERTHVMQKLNTMRNPTDIETRRTRRSLILILTPHANPFFAPRVQPSATNKQTRFPDEFDTQAEQPVSASL